MERFNRTSRTAFGTILAFLALLISVLLPYLFNNKVGPLGFPWVFTSAVVSQMLVLFVCIYFAVLVWRTKGGDG